MAVHTILSSQEFHGNISHTAGVKPRYFTDTHRGIVRSFRNRSDVVEITTHAIGGTTPAELDTNPVEMSEEGRERFSTALQQRSITTPIKRRKINAIKDNRSKNESSEDHSTARTVRHSIPTNAMINKSYSRALLAYHVQMTFPHKYS